jgi:hypothetical protein
MTDWIGRSTYGNAGLDVFYDANGVPIAADDPFAANQPTILLPAWLGGATVPLVRAEVLSGERKLRLRNGDLLYAVTPGGGPTSGGVTPTFTGFFDNADPVKDLLAGQTLSEHTSLHTTGSGGTRQAYCSVGAGSNTYSYYVGAPSDPLWDISVPNHRGRLAQTLHLRAPANIHNGGGSDLVLQIGNYIDIGGGVLKLVIFDFYQTTINASTSPPTISCGAWGCCFGDDTAGMTLPGTNIWAAGNSFGDGTPGGQDFSSGKNAGVRASDANWMAGGLSKADIIAVAGGATELDHAFCGAANSDMCQNVTHAPATAHETSGVNSGILAGGDRLCLLPSYTIPASASPILRAVLNTLKNRGWYQMDHTGGSQWFISCDAGQNPVANSDVNTLYEFWNFSPTLNDSNSSWRYTTGT